MRKLISAATCLMLFVMPAARAQTVIDVSAGPPVVIDFNGTATTPPSNTTLQIVQDDGLHNRVVAESYGDAQTSLHLRHALGTAASKEALDVNAYIGTVKMEGWDGSAWRSAGSLAFRSGLAWTASSGSPPSATHESFFKIEMPGVVYDYDFTPFFIHNGHWGYNRGNYDPAPGLGSDCGMGAAVIQGGDVFARLTLGTSPGAQCTVTFIRPFRKSNSATTFVTPVCTANAEDGDYALKAVNVTAQSLQLMPAGGASQVAGHRYGFHCFQPDND